MAENEFDGEASDPEGSELRESEIEGEAAEEQATECSEQHVAQKPQKKTKLKKRRKRLLRDVFLNERYLMTTANSNLWLNFICRCLGVNLSNCKYESGE